MTNADQVAFSPRNDDNDHIEQAKLSRLQESALRAIDESSWKGRSQLLTAVTEAKNLNIPDSLLTPKIIQSAAAIWRTELDAQDTDISELFRILELTAEQIAEIGKVCISLIISGRFGMGVYPDNIEKIEGVVDFCHFKTDQTKQFVGNGIIRAFIRAHFKDGYSFFRWHRPESNQLLDAIGVKALVIYDFSVDDLHELINSLIINYPLETLNIDEVSEYIQRVINFSESSLKLPRGFVFESTVFCHEIDRLVIKHSVDQQSLVRNLEQMPNGYTVSDNELLAIIKREVEDLFEFGYYQDNLDILAIFNRVCNINDSIPIYLHSALTNFKIDLSAFTESDRDKFREYFNYLRLTKKEPAVLLPEDTTVLDKLGLSLSEGEVLKRNKIDLEHIHNENDYQQICTTLIDHHQVWSDELVSEPFLAGAKFFGYERMFRYITFNKKGPHDAMYGFNDVSALYKFSTLTPDQFYGNIIDQVMRDTVQYEDGSALDHFTAIAQTFDYYQQAFIDASNYSEIEGFQEFITKFSSKETIFQSWSNLKVYAERVEILQQYDFLETLNSLKFSGNKSLAKYVEILMFHSDSKVSANSILEFINNPYAFVNHDDNHTIQELHNRKKPSNYTEIPNLDLTAEEMRDALVEGTLDTLQAFSPFEITYILPAEGEEWKLSLRGQISKALGSKEQKILGLARKPNVLFLKIHRIFTQFGLSLGDYLRGQEVSDEIMKVITPEIETQLFNPSIGIDKPTEPKTQVFVASIPLKSSAQAAIAGNDTVNCMPFGSGKNTVYTFNLNTGMFLLQLERSDGSRRTLAESVLTKDVNVGIPIPNIVEAIEDNRDLVGDLSSITALSNQQRFICCDNVEVAPNYTAEYYQQVYKTIYRDFFRRYLEKFSMSSHLNRDLIPIGMGYADALKDLPTGINQYLPQAPVGYSDKTHDEVFLLHLNAKTPGPLPILNLYIQPTPESSGLEFEPISLPPTIELLTFEDSLLVAHLESKAYQGTTLIQLLHNMENALMAKDINNRAKNRPNLSLKYRDTEGRIRGYLLAYEGICTDQAVINQDPTLDQCPIIYIADLATDQEQKGIGLELLRTFMDLYKTAYLSNGLTTPIFAQLRESTSYQYIKRGIESLTAKLGIDDVQFQVVELESYYEGDDSMHPVIISPVTEPTQ